MRIIIVEIRNWEKYNPRSDIKSSSWFRMSNDFFNDPDFYGQALVVRLTWLFILCIASKKITSTVKINTKQIADAISFTDMRFKEDEIHSSIIILSKIESEDGPILEIKRNFNEINTIGFDRNPQSNFPLHTDEQTDVTNVTDIHTDTAFAKKNLLKKDSEEILGHWNSMIDGRGHSGSKIQLEKISEALKKLQKDFSLEQIKQGISNYFNVLYGEDFFYSHQFTCWDFLSRKNNVNFMPGLFNEDSYKSFGSKNNSRSNLKQSHRTQSTVTDAEIEEARKLGIL